MPVLALGDDPTEVRRARHWVLGRCEQEQVRPDVRDAVELVTSELVANAYQHGRPPVTISVLPGGGGLVLEVTDVGGGSPAVRDADLDSLGGRGLALVEMLAVAWGVCTREGAGKTVWCRLHV